MTEADEFKTELLENCAKAEKEYGCLQKKLLSDIDRYGAVETIKEIIRKNRISDGFYALKKAGHLELSAETLVTEKKYGGLFSDSDVNYCLQVLCENGFYN